MSGFPNEPFWDFSVALYERSGVKAACLALQARHGLDVNVLLLCCWLGVSGRGVASEEQMNAVLDRVDDWHRDVVRALREIRDRLKGGFPPAPAALVASLRDRMISVEIDCERVEQLMLAEDAPAEPDDSPETDETMRATVANVLHYFRLLEVNVGPEDRDDLAVVLAGCFPEERRELLSALLAGAAT